LRLPDFASRSAAKPRYGFLPRLPASRPVADGTKAASTPPRTTWSTSRILPRGMRHLAEAYTGWPDLRAIGRDYSPGSGSASTTTVQAGLQRARDGAQAGRRL